MLKIRRPLWRLIFNMGTAIPGKTVFLIETAPGSCRSLGVSRHIIDYVEYVVSLQSELYLSVPNQIQEMIQYGTGYFIIFITIQLAKS